MDEADAKAYVNKTRWRLNRYANAPADHEETIVRRLEGINEHQKDAIISYLEMMPDEKALYGNGLHFWV